MRYKVRPEPDVDAIQWTGDNLNEIKEFLGDKFIRVAAADPNHIAVNTVPGPRFVPLGHFLVKRASNRITAVESDRFLNKYMPA